MTLVDTVTPQLQAIPDPVCVAQLSIVFPSETESVPISVERKLHMGTAVFQ